MIGRRIRNLREGAGLTLQELADKVYCLPENKGRARSSQHIGYIERGERPLSPEWSMLLAKIFDVRVDYLMLKDDFKTDHEKLIMPILTDFFDKQKRNRAIEECLRSFGLSIELENDIEVPEEYVKQEDDVLLTNKAAIDWMINAVCNHKIEYTIKNSSGEVVKKINKSEKDRFIDEIGDFFEFKIIKLVGNVKNIVSKEAVDGNSTKT